VTKNEAHKGWCCDVLLTIDVGNTNIVAGIFAGDKLLANFRMATDKTKTSDEIGMTVSQLLSFKGIDKTQIEDIIISSVVPPVMHTLGNACRRYVGKKPLIVGQDIKPNINIKYDNPNEVGADRIVNAVAARAKYGAPLIIVDFGTATTFCAVDKNGDYAGGVIATGIKISMDALFEKAAKLPRIEIVPPPSVIGKNTVASMQSGAVYGYVGQVEYMVKRIKEELNASEAQVVATGGLAALIAEHTESIDFVDRLLTLDGLRIIYYEHKN
jgi:type III pantothenate kinase